MSTPIGNIQIRWQRNYRRTEGRDVWIN